MTARERPPRHYRYTVQRDRTVTPERVQTNVGWEGGCVLTVEGAPEQHKLYTMLSVAGLYFAGDRITAAGFDNPPAAQEET